MDRRRFLAVGAAGVGLFAGCPGQSDTTSETPPATATRAHTETETATATPSRQSQTDRREFDPLSDPLFDIACTYKPVGGNWPECVPGEPVGGWYNGPTEPVLTRHIDQLAGAGCSRVLVQVFREGHLARADRLSRPVLGDGLRSTFLLPVAKIEAGETTIPEFSRRVGEFIAQHDRYSTIDGRPVVHLRLGKFWWSGGEEFRDSIEETYDSYAAVLETMRTEIGQNGSDPYFVGNVGMPSRGTFRNADEDILNLVSTPDALTNSVWPHKDDEWNRLKIELSEVYRTIRARSEDTGQAFIPRVIPGVNAAANECSEPTRSLPREPEQFRDLLDLAGMYSTTNRLVIDSFNDWWDGTQIEAGTYANTAYGDKFLTTVSEFQTGGSVTDFDRTTHYVSPEGKITGSGTEEDPIGSIQEAIFRADPGETVHVLPGQYLEKVSTVRDGEPDAPITITGPPEAVFAGIERGRSFEINHSHIHITGLTFDGFLDPDNPDRRSSYASQQIHVAPKTPRYLTGIRIMPHGVGNVLGPAVNVEVVEDIEIGEFQVIGPTGLKYVKFGDPDHLGEIVYIGTPPPQVVDHPIEGYDESNGVHVHHIDNSAGHAHSEIVNAKLGTYDIVVEYCTDGGGSQNNEDYPSASVRLQSYDATVRWCGLSDGSGHGIEVASSKARDAQQAGGELSEPERQGGTDNAIYGNRISDFDDGAFSFPLAEEGQSPEAQRHLCGNEVPESAIGGDDCPESVPVGEGIGHLGGESPWS